MIALSPLIVLNKVVLASRLIVENLMPYFLNKDSDLQIEITKVLPVVACISMGNYTVDCSMVTNCDGHSIFRNETVNLSVLCSNCHIANKDSKRFTVFSENNHTTLGNTKGSALRPLVAKFLNSKQYIAIEKTEYWTMIDRLCRHFYVFSKGVPSEMITVDNCQHIVKALQPYIDNMLVCIFTTSVLPI